jgi:RimJ/RimL family protein N-acetyltransferase
MAGVLLGALGAITAEVRRWVIMSDTASYLAHEHLGNGARIEIRLLRPSDEADMLDLVKRISTQSLQRRFFAVKRDFSEKERAFFMKTDLRNHVALVALTREEDRPVIIGGGRYIVFETGRAEMAFMVADDWQRQGIGSLLLRHLVKIAREAGLQELTAEVLSENAAMLKVFAKFDFRPVTQPDPQTIHLILPLHAAEAT